MIDINSKNLLLRKFKKKDIDKEYLNWFRNNKNFIYSRHKDKYYDFKDLIQYFNIQNSNKDSILLICIDKITNKKVGTVTIYLDKQINVADVGILIGNDDFKNKFSSIVLEEKPKLKKPPLYKVIMLNDDYTPMEFVIEMLQTYFSKSQEQATEIMLHIHQKGIGICGLYTYEIAESKATQVLDKARKNQHPLQIKLEKE